ncbi:vWA domain-containing protein [Alkaliphilus crotonatoxidans]
MSKEATIRQIVLVTDGESNMGGDPVLAARAALRQGITVNTVGIIAQNQQKEKPFEEIVNIAKAGGGLYEYSYIEALSQTIQSLSYQTVSSTLKETVNRQLKEIIGSDLSQMAPDSRSKILNYIDEYSEEITIYCCILLDCSGSMTTKIQAARHSIMDLVESFRGRRGTVHLAVVGFPGDGKASTIVLQNFGENPQQLERSLYRIKPGGATPTALAIERGIELIEEYTGIKQHMEPQCLEEFIG